MDAVGTPHVHAVIDDNREVLEQVPGPAAAATRLTLLHRPSINQLEWVDHLDKALEDLKKLARYEQALDAFIQPDLEKALKNELQAHREWAIDKASMAQKAIAVHETTTHAATTLMQHEAAAATVRQQHAAASSAAASLASSGPHTAEQDKLSTAGSSHTDVYVSPRLLSRPPPFSPSV